MSVKNIAVELAENEEDKSEKTSFESSDEFFQFDYFEWNERIKALPGSKFAVVDNNIEEHIREIVPPPPQV